MKKIIIFGVLVFAVSITACGGSSGSSTDSISKGITAESKQESSEKTDVTVDEQVLVDQDGVTVTLKGYDEKGFFGPEFQIETVNNSDRPIMVAARETSVNGIMIDPLFVVSVEPGKISNDEMSVFGSNLKAAGIDTIQTVEFKFGVSDDETWDSIFETDFIKIDTSAAGTFTQTYNDEGTEIYNDGTFKIVAQKLESEDSFWGADIYLYIENNSDKTVTFQTRDTSINGFMVDPMFSTSVTPGKKAFSTITFLESDLESNGIESIDSLETSFHIFDEATWDTISDTAPITVNFN